MEAILEVKKGEKPYQAAVSDWLQDADGPVLFKVISKKRGDGKIEAVYFTEREDNLKRIIDRISLDEKDFEKAMECIENSLRQFFPDIKFRVENLADILGGGE